MPTKTRTLGFSKCHFFYGGEFSQWWPCALEIDGILYNCAEQYMMAQKATLFQDAEALSRIMMTKDPSEQKAIGRRVIGYSDVLWHSVARDVVRSASYAKFIQNPELMEVLFETSETYLVEASPTDRIWGIGLGEDDPMIHDPDNWRGKNWLGHVLTEVRMNLERGLAFR